MGVDTQVKSCYDDGVGWKLGFMSFYRVYLRVLQHIGPEKGLAVVLVLANLALALAQFAEPVLFGRIIDQLVGPDSTVADARWAALLPLLLSWGGFGLFTIFAAVLVALHADRLSHRRRIGVMADYFEHVLHLPMGFHSATHSGRLLKIMLDGVAGMGEVWLSFFRQNCASFVSVFVLLPASLLINWQLGTLLIVLIILFGASTALVLRRTEKLQSNVEHYHTVLAERASDVLGNIAVIQSFTRIDEETSALRDASQKVLNAQLPVLSWWAVLTVATKASATLTLIALFCLGIVLHNEGKASIGEIITFMNFAGMLTVRLDQVVGFSNWIMLLVPKLAQFFAILDLRPFVHDRPHARDYGRLNGHVVFDRVSFSYDGQRQAIVDISFDAKRGETIALVGATGSGKSTTLSLLHRMYDPTEGRILIDGIDIADMTLKSLRRNIGVVFQEPLLFARTIEDNVRMGKADASEREVALALERAQAHGLIDDQPHALKTLVGERGRALSGGERQRLSIARALLKDPPIMIFDEATSALDAQTEHLLQKSLEAATAGRTTLVIAHRLATIRHATRILVFDKGRIVEQGHFDELMRANGLFAQLARAQFIAVS
jgi:ATP-binding cassette, subfamily B, beta-glucan exporter